MKNVLTHIIDEKISKGIGPETALRFKRQPSVGWEDLSWNSLSSLRDRTASALLKLGTTPQNRIAIFSANRPEILITDFAAYAIRAVPISIYSTSTPQQVRYILEDAGISTIFVGDQIQYDAVMQIISDTPVLKNVIAYDDSIKFREDDKTTIHFSRFTETGNATSEEIRKITADAVPEDVATFIYTSGTTGEPKGAVLTHSNFDAALEIHDERLTMLSSKDTSLCFLPLSHIFEKAWTYYCLHLSMVVSINRDPKEITNALREVRPTCMCSVPRFWEKAYNLIQDKMSRQKGFKRMLVRWALAVGRRRNLVYTRVGRKAPFLTELAYRFFDARIFSGVRRVMGIENGNIFPTAGAPLSDSINEFFHAIGVNLVIGYGLSETTATVCCFPQKDWLIGSVGTALPEINVRIGEQNEIQVKAPTVMKGYWNKPEQTSEAFTPDGWFRTGDAGVIDTDGNIMLTDRIKDLFKTSNGKYIAPQMLETRLVQDPYIDQVAVIGDRRKYVTAIIIPAFEVLKEYADSHGISYSNIRELIADSRIIQLVADHIEKLQSNLANFEKIKKFTLIPRELTIEDGELTNTLKIRRNVINRHFAKEIEAMYQA